MGSPGYGYDAVNDEPHALYMKTGHAPEVFYTQVKLWKKGISSWSITKDWSLIRTTLEPMAIRLKQSIV